MVQSLVMAHPPPAYGFSYNHENYFVDLSLNGRQTLQTAAQQHTGQNAFHLFSHGRPGELLINGQWLDAKQIAQWLTNEQRIKSTVQQINLYGCNFAKGEKGRQAVAYLEKALGISIAASIDITGKDGDWELEYGNILASSIEIEDYSYNLAICGLVTDGDILINNGVGDVTQLNSINGEGATFNGVGEYLLFDLGSAMPSGTVITIGTFTPNSGTRTLRVSQSNITGADEDNPVDIEANSLDNNVTETTYTLNAATQYLKLRMIVRSFGRMEVDYVAITDCEDTALLCGDGIDNDLDGYIDNFDSDCPNHAPWLCDGKLYQSLKPSGDSNYYLYEVTTDPVDLDPLFNLTANGVTAPEFNSIAYNPVDNFIYGSNYYSPRQLYRINSLGEVQYLGNMSGLSSDNMAGAMGPNGEYYVTGTSRRLYQVNLNTLAATEIADIGILMTDIAVNPADSQIYGWDENTNQLAKVDPSDGTVYFIGSPDTRWRTFGALYFNLQGEIIAYGDDTNITETHQETLVKIDPDTGVVTVLGTGPETNSNDGCSCAYGIELTKAAAPTTVNAGDVFTYTFTVINRTGSALTNITFNDVLTDGFLWASEPENLTGLTLGSTTITGTATANFTITNLPDGASNSFTIDVLVPYNFCEEYSNQAKLLAIPAIYGTEILSDNPNTPAILDTTDVAHPNAGDTDDNEGDGVYDHCDYDDDNDGISDITEGSGDFDGDSIINQFDPDSDADGCPDVLEGGGTYWLSDIDEETADAVLDLTIRPVDGLGQPRVPTVPDPLEPLDQGMGVSQNTTTNATSHVCNDYGDAPVSYFTNSDDSTAGPTHPLVLGGTSTLYLGATQPGIDISTVAASQAVAAGGDANAPNGDGAEEDGVVFSWPAGGDITATVTGKNSTGSAAMLCGWLDGAANGTVNNGFTSNITYVADNVGLGSGATVGSGNEEVCIQVPAAGGTSATYAAVTGFNGASASCSNSGGNFSCTLEFKPGFTAAGKTYARFRLTSDTEFFSNSSPSPTGPAGDGEVEDYGVDYNATAVTIGDVELGSVPVADFLSQIGADQMDVAALYALLTKWAPDLAASVDANDREAMLAALTQFLDSDGDGQVAIIAWDTLEERGTIGFYVERQEDGGFWITLNDEMLPGLITAPMGGEYKLADPEAVSGRLYQYRLIEQEARGTKRSYGPFELEMQ